MEKKKRIVKCTIDESGRLGITAMGLVDMPAIEENWIALSGRLSTMKLSATDGKRRMLYGAALVPDKQILRRTKDGEEYYVFFDQPTIMQVAHQFFKKNLHHTTNLQHEVPVTGVTVVESWVKEGDSDKSIALGLSEDLPAGTWFIGTKVDSDDVWQEVEAGTVKGFSIEGLFSEIGVEMAGLKSDEELFLEELETLLSSWTGRTTV